MPPSKLNFAGPATLQKELQGVARFEAYEKIFTQGDGKARANQESKIGVMYHGNGQADQCSLAMQCLKGLRLFQGLYDKEMVDIADANNKEGSKQLVLKLVFHCLPNQRIHVGPTNGGITLQLLSAKTLSDRSDSKGLLLGIGPNWVQRYLPYCSS